MKISYRIALLIWTIYLQIRVISLHHYSQSVMASRFVCSLWPWQHLGASSGAMLVAEQHFGHHLKWKNISCSTYLGYDIMSEIASFYEKRKWKQVVEVGSIKTVQHINPIYLYAVPPTQNQGLPFMIYSTSRAEFSWKIVPLAWRLENWSYNVAR